jgi:hypothetical protein
LTYRGSIRHQTRALALDDPPVRLGLAMHIEIERRLPERPAQVLVAARKRWLVALGRARCDDFA